MVYRQLLLQYQGVSPNSAYARDLWYTASRHELELIVLDALQTHLEIPNDPIHRRARQSPLLRGYYDLDRMRGISTRELAEMVAAPYRQESATLNAVLGSLLQYEFAELVSVKDRSHQLTKGEDAWKITTSGLQYLRNETNLMTYLLLQKNSQDQQAALESGRTAIFRSTVFARLVRSLVRIPLAMAWRTATVAFGALFSWLTLNQATRFLGAYLSRALRACRRGMSRVGGLIRKGLNSVRPW